jgi:hypothetical protein
MKNTMLILALIVSLASCKKDATADNTAGNITVIPASAVPTAVVSSFNSSFSGATEVEWHKSSGIVSSQFNHNSSRNHASFDDNGTRRSHSVISLSAVSAAVLAAFRLQFANDNVYEWKLRNDGTWKAHFMRGTVKWEVTLTASGTIIKTESYG